MVRRNKFWFVFMSKFGAKGWLLKILFKLTYFTCLEFFVYSMYMVGLGCWREVRSSAYVNIPISFTVHRICTYVITRRVIVQSVCYERFTDLS